MNEPPLVSVIIIFLNAQKFIAEAIESVLDQTYPHWELLLVDDGSTDASTQMALHYAQKHPEKIRYLDHEGHRNRGMSASRNWGIAHAKGTYVAFLDADDVWLPQKLEEQVAILQTHPKAAMVYGPALFWYGWTGKAEDAKQDFVQDLHVPLNAMVPPPKLFTLFLREPAFSPAPSGIMVRAEFLRSIGGFNDTSPGMYDDQGFYTKICTRAPVYVSSHCWYRYRRHPGAYCVAALSDGRARQERHTYLTWAKTYLAEHQLDTPEVRAALKRELFPYEHPHRFRVRRWAETTGTKAVRGLKVLGRSCVPDALWRWWKTKRGVLR